MSKVIAGLLVMGVLLAVVTGAPSGLRVTKDDDHITFGSSKSFVFTANYPLCISGIGSTAEVVYTQTKLIRVYYYPTAVYCVNQLCKPGSDW